VDNHQFQKIEEIFKYFLLFPDKIVLLQEETIKFEPESWNNVFESLKSEISGKKFLYIFIKYDGSLVKSIYIGKSTTKNINRLKQHFKGLSLLEDNFYIRMHAHFFKKDKKLPLFLVLFFWNKERIIKNILPFELHSNLSNAEAILISYFALRFPRALINHNFISRQKWQNSKFFSNLLNFKLKTLSKKEYLIEILGNDSISLWNEWFNTWFLKEENIPFPPLSNKINLIPLFDYDEKSYRVKFEDINGLKILKRHPFMIDQVIKAAMIIEESYNYYSQIDNNNAFGDYEEQVPFFTDGLIYMVYVLRSDIKTLPDFSQESLPSKFIPLYIGKTETLGRNGNFSANLKGVSAGKNRQYFARWGHDKARHIGGLSSCFFNVENPYQSTDYESWIKIMFDDDKRKEGIPQLKIPIYFQIKPWFPFNINFSNQIGLFTPELETLLISLARMLFPNILINKQGR